MQEHRTTPTFTSDHPDSDALTTIVARSILEAALAEGEPAELWFELERDEDEEPSRLTVELLPSDIDQLLGMSPEDEIALSLDGESVESLFVDPDVEGHGLKGALAVAVTSAAILAPAGQAAAPQVVDAAVGGQRTSPAVAARARPAARAEIVGAASRTEVSNALVARAGGFRLLRTVLVR